MLFNDRLIHDHGPSLIRPYQRERVQPASYDLSLANRFVTVAPNAGDRHESWRRATEDAVVTVDPGGVYWIPAHGFVLAETAETVTLPRDLAARIEGKSTIGRQALLVHTAGFVDPGFEGTLTLELANVTDYPIGVQPGQLIAQLWFHMLLEPAERPYGSPGLGSRYQGQSGPTPARERVA